MKGAKHRPATGYLEERLRYVRKAMLKQNKTDTSESNEGIFNYFYHQLCLSLMALFILLINLFTLSISGCAPRSYGSM